MMRMTIIVALTLTYSLPLFASDSRLAPAFGLDAGWSFISGDHTMNYDGWNDSAGATSAQMYIEGFYEPTEYLSIHGGVIKGILTQSSSDFYDSDQIRTTGTYPYNVTKAGGGVRFKYPASGWFLGKVLMTAEPSIGISYYRYIGGNSNGGVPSTEDELQQESPLLLDLGIPFSIFISDNVFLRVSIFNYSIVMNSQLSDKWYSPGAYVSSFFYRVSQGLSLGYLF